MVLFTVHTKVVKSTQRLYIPEGQPGRRKKRLLGPGIEPGSSACEALVLTDIRSKLSVIMFWNEANKYYDLQYFHEDLATLHGGIMNLSAVKLQAVLRLRGV